MKKHGAVHQIEKVATGTMLSNALVIANGKGGVGKTSLVSSISAIAASSGWKTLAVDLDTQGNLGDDLGYHNHEHDDQGTALLKLLLFGDTDGPPIINARPNLDVYPGGMRLQDAEATLAVDVQAGERLDILNNGLAPIAGEYDLIVFDTPPSGFSALAKLALATARGLVVPVRHDTSSLRGLEVLGNVYRDVKNTANPGLELLGAVQFEMGTQETRARKELAATLRTLLTDPKIQIYEPPIRHSNVAAMHMRQRGETIIEYETHANDWLDHVFERLRNHTMAEAGRRPSQAASGLADDYMEVTRQILISFGATT